MGRTVLTMVLRRVLSLLLMNVLQQTQCPSFRCSGNFEILVTGPSLQVKIYFFLAAPKSKERWEVNLVVPEAHQDQQ